MSFFDILNTHYIHIIYILSVYLYRCITTEKLHENAVVLLKSISSCDFIVIKTEKVYFFGENLFHIRPIFI